MLTEDLSRKKIQVSAPSQKNFWRMKTAALQIQPDTMVANEPLQQTNKDSSTITSISCPSCGSSMLSTQKVCDTCTEIMSRMVSDEVALSDASNTTAESPETTTAEAATMETTIITQESVTKAIEEEVPREPQDSLAPNNEILTPVRRSLDFSFTKEETEHKPDQKRRCIEHISDDDNTSKADDVMKTQHSEKGPHAVGGNVDDIRHDHSERLKDNDGVHKAGMISQTEDRSHDSPAIDGSEDGAMGSMLSPVRTTVPAAVTPPSSQSEDKTHEDHSDDIVLNLTFRGVGKAARESILKAQSQRQLIEVSFPGSDSPIAHGHISSMTILSPETQYGKITVASQGGLVPQESPGRNSASAPAAHLMCPRCGKEKEQSWMSKCRKCYAITMNEKGAGNKIRGTCEDCGIKTEEQWMYKCRGCFNKTKNESTDGTMNKEPTENDTNPQNETPRGQNCLDCGKETDYKFMTRCSACFAQWRRTHKTNHGGTCRYCQKELSSEWKTCCGDCFKKYKLSSPKGSEKCPSCGKKPPEDWMVWCPDCYHKNKK